MNKQQRHANVMRLPRRAALLVGIGAAVVLAAACAPATGGENSPAAGPTPAPAVEPTAAPAIGVALPTAPPPTGATQERSSATTAPSAEEGVNVGQRAPDFTLPALDASQVRLSDFRGKTVLVNFWASWCPPCREEMPALNDLYHRYQDRGFVVLAINMAEDPATASAFIKKGEFTFPVAVDQNGDWARTYQAFSLPVSYIVSPEGIVQDRIIGAMTAQIMEMKAQRFLASVGQPSSHPGSVVEAEGAANDQVVATIGGEKVTMRDVNQQVDLQLAMERLETGAVLDPSRPSDQAELKDRQSYALDEAINQKLLADAGREAGLNPDPADVDEPMSEFTTRAGGPDKLPGELAKHGVTVDDLKAYFQDKALADAYVMQGIVKQPGATSLDDAVNRWIGTEKARRGVKVLANLGNGTQ